MAHLTREEVVASGVVNPEYQKIFSTKTDPVPSKPLTTMAEARSHHLASVRHLYPVPGPIPDQVTETMHTVPARDGHPIPVRVYQPVAGPPPNGSPLIVMYHEGSWSMGDLSDEDQNCRLFARDLGAVCVNVDYRLAPQHPFPTGVNDCYDALEWAVSHAASLAATPTRGLIVGGASAGGNLAAAIALLARDNNLQPPVTGQYLCVPAVLPPDLVPARFAPLYQSRLSSVDDPVFGDSLARHAGTGGIELVYRPDPDSPLWCPFRHPAGHARAPRAFIQAAGLDPLRDEAVLYDRVLREAGVLTRFDLYPHLGHMFWTNWPQMEVSRRFVEDIVRGVRWLLED